MAGNPYGLTGIASLDLGLGDMLGQQQKDETEEQRKKRLAGLPDPRADAMRSGMLNPTGGALGSPTGR
jgi:hypothetical protein